MDDEGDDISPQSKDAAVEDNYYAFLNVSVDVSASKCWTDWTQNNRS